MEKLPGQAQALTFRVPGRSQNEVLATGPSARAGDGMLAVV